MLQTKIDPDQIGLIIGKGGETIRGLQEEFDVQIDIEEDGFVRIYASSATIGEGCRAAHRADDAADRGRRRLPRRKRVVKTADFGAFVELRKGTDGLLHASRVAPGVRIDSVDQVLQRGDIVAVEVTEVDTERGRIALKLVSKTEDDAEVTPEADRRALQGAVPERRPGPAERRPRRAIAAATAAAAAARAAAATAAAVRVAARSDDARGALDVALAGDEGAPPLVLLHGLGERWQVWSGAIAAPRAARCAWSRSTCPGFGALAAAARRAVRPRRRLRRASTAALDELGVERPRRCAGHSLGGGVGVPTRPSARSACGGWRWSPRRA